MILLKHVGFFLIWAIGFCFSPEVQAAESPVTSATLERVGFGGRFKVGQWTPLVVRVENDRACQAELQVEVADPDGNRTVWTEDFPLDAAGTHRLAMLFQAGRLNVSLRPRVVVRSDSGEDEWTVPVSAGEGEAAQLSHKALTHAVLLVGTLGEPGGLPDEGESDGTILNENRVPVFVTAIENPEELTVISERDPKAAFTNANGLEALDTLILSGRYDLSENQSEAIRTWVTLGGHLILSVGSEWETYRASPLADWISNEAPSGETRPFRITGTTPFLRLDNLESFAGGNPEPIEINRQSPVVTVKVEHGQEVETLVPAPNGSLIARSAYGMGTITLVGLSLSEDPVRSWSSLPQVMAKLLWDERPPTEARSKSSNSQLAYTGIGEFATQLHTALVTYPRVHRLSTWTIIGLMAAYLLVIGPLDYLLVHQVLGRPRYTWFTLPVLVVLASAFCVWIARSQNGETLITNQVNVLDYDVSTQTLRSRSWASLYSPETRRYQVTFEAQPFSKSATEGRDPSVRMAWFGVPETSFGGMYREGGQQILPPKYQFAPGARRIENLPVPIWGAKAFTGEWFEQGTAWVESDLKSQRPGQLRGTIRHNFPVPITDWFIAFDNWVFLPRTNLVTGEPDPLLPHATWPPDPASWTTNQRDMEGFLTQSVAKEFQREDDVLEDVQTIRMEKTPYDPLEQDNPDPLGDIVRILSFHRKVGGKQYTGLDNFAFRNIDLSDRLQLRQAVLFGRLDVSPTKLQIQDHEVQEDRQATLIRIVLPVQVTREEETFFSDGRE